jgi:kynureninase
MALTIDQGRAYDRADPLRRFRERFALPDGIIYLDGNSLGALPKATAARMQALVAQEWGESLIGGWNKHGWIDAPIDVGARIAALVGAKAHEVIVADSTSVNLFKLLVAAARASGGRRILTESGNFHTDLHVAAGVAELLGLELDIAPRSDVLARIGPDVAVLLLTHVHYKSAERFDMSAVTAQAKAAGVRTLWDLSHSAGAVPLALGEASAELAVGCGYKYLNGGPGAPAFLYVAEHLQDALGSPIQGWMGHAAPFAFTDDYAPAAGIARWLAGTPPILGLAALGAGLDTFEGVTMARLWAKSIELFDILHLAMEELCPALECITPRGPEQRGSHISFRFPHAFELCQALIAQGVIGDFRAPDVIRFGLTPLYVSAEDVVRAAEIAGRIMREESWRRPEFAVRGKVT